MAVTVDPPKCQVAALRYAKRGWRVFPLDGKQPYAGTNGHKDATLDRKEIRAWWKQWPKANVGIACSSRRGPIIFDIDGPSGFGLLDELSLPETREAVSQKGRLHLYFDPPLSGQRIKRMIKPFKDGGKKIAIDILGDGGYVVAPPSIHPDTGRAYTWRSQIDIAPFPQTIIDRIGDTIDLSQHQSAPPIPDMIGEGERDNMLTSMAGTMRRRGADEGTILAALRYLNETRVNPPLADKDLRRIAKSIAAKPPAGIGENMTDLGNARRFIAQHSDGLRFIRRQSSWLTYDGLRWADDETGEVERAAKNTVRSLYAEAAQAGDEDVRDSLLKHAAKSESSSRVRGLIELASTEPEISISAGALDNDIFLLNVENGTIDLNTGKRRPHDRLDLITKLAPVEYIPKADCPRWKQFLLDIMLGDAELVDYLQRALGYSMTGDTREECLFFCYGGGANGKSTLLENFQWLIGDYGQIADFSSFIANRGDGPRNDLARMRGMRFITASEAEGDKPFDSRIIKMLTGNDTMVARRLYEEAFEFRPTHKIWLGANHQPIVKEATDAFWRRMRLIPFKAKFEGKNRVLRPVLDAIFLKERPGILNWALEGTRKWRESGLLEPRAVRRATAEYKDNNDLLGEFLTARCVIESASWTSSTDLYRVFSEWWLETRGQRAAAISMGWFTRLLSERSEFEQRKRSQVRGWKGIAVTTKVGERE